MASLALICLLAVAAAIAAAIAESAVAPGTKPNIILLFNDDQDITLGGTTPMAFTEKLMSTGATVDNFFVNTPVCCPSRTTLLSGGYPHNWHTTTGGCMHMNVMNDQFRQRTIGIYMKALGYTTGQFGKLLNPNGVAAYCAKTNAVPVPGFDSYLTMCNDNRYFGNTFTSNGTFVEKGKDPEDYLTSVIGNHSLDFIEASLQAGRPFFAYISPHAPHVPATPAPWYADKFSDKQAPRTPNYNYSAADHHYVIRSQPILTSKEGNESDALFRDRWRSLLSVDDITKDVVSLLEKYDQVDNTYILWTSDHGFQLGQFRLPSCKLQPYDHDIRVPFRIKGPGLKQGSHSFVASMVDVAPTIIELGGGTVPEEMDGHSFASLLMSDSSAPKDETRDRMTIEYWTLGNVIRYGHYIDMPNNTYIGIRLVNDTHNYLYVEYYQDVKEMKFTDKGFEFELFDVSKDPYQMKNLYGTPEADDQLVTELHEYLHKQVVCKGQEECKL
ncbi:PREDICTED: extracellular sulfatase Sulf-1-like [Amphimedon queenslandica]|nr:PREDICTED: extracellular sulfatase Sulf-1-like [Amphimedon queenslandica]|eukprot:XP_003384556.1 PREDICTED: extracellular sulfatase Sulf-1-like [Amphimedon queenslandica]